MMADDEASEKVQVWQGCQLLYHCTDFPKGHYNMILFCSPSTCFDVVLVRVELNGLNVLCSVGFDM